MIFTKDKINNTIKKSYQSFKASLYKKFVCISVMFVNKICRLDKKIPIKWYRLKK